MWHIQFDVPGEHSLEFLDVLDPFLGAVSTSVIEGSTDWRVEGYSEFEPDQPGVLAAVEAAAIATGIGAPSVEIAEIEDRDWLAENRQSFPPLHIGRFYIYGSHIEDPLPKAVIPLQIDAAEAFGSGTHATTSGCLMAMQRLGKSSRPARILDLGCGTAILGMAASKLWPTAKTLAADNDPVAVRTAADNVRLNQLSQQIDCAVSQGYRSRAVAAGGPYDLIVANILAGPLIKMAPELVRHLRPGGTVILSGILISQETAVRAAHVNQGLRFVRNWHIGEWTTLMFRR